MVTVTVMMERAGAELLKRIQQVRCIQEEGTQLQMRERQQPFSSLKLPPNSPKLVELQKLLYGIGTVSRGVLAGALPAADTFLLAGRPLQSGTY